MSEMWNHYAAAFFRSGLPFTTISHSARIPDCRNVQDELRHAGRARDKRYFSIRRRGRRADPYWIDGWLAHGAVRHLAVFAIRFFTDMAIPGWATYASGVLAIILVQFITMAISFTFIMLSNRTNLSFVPLRDHSLFVSEVKLIPRQ